MNAPTQALTVDRSRRQWVFSAALLIGGPTWMTSTWAALPPAGDALERSALKVRTPFRTMLLAADVAGRSIIAVGERGIVIRSEDDGQRWTQVDIPTSVTLTAVLFLDAQRGLAAGHGGVILQTLDGGRTWRKRIDGHGIARLTLEDAKRRSDAAALQSAERLVAEGADKPLLSLERLSGDRVIAAGAYGITAVSDDGGTSWRAPTNPIANPKGLHVYAIRAQGRRVVLVGEQGLLLMSDDAGERFSPVPTPYRGTLFTADMLPDGAIGIAGLRGNAFTSDDAGQSWHRSEMPGTATVNHSAVVGGSWLLANQAGQVMRKAGSGFVPMLKDALPPINALLPLSSGALIALTVGGVVRVPSIGDLQAVKQ